MHAAQHSISVEEGEELEAKMNKNSTYRYFFDGSDLKNTARINESQPRPNQNVKTGKISLLELTGLAANAPHNKVNERSGDKGRFRMRFDNHIDDSPGGDNNDDKSHGKNDTFLSPPELMHLLPPLSPMFPLIPHETRPDPLLATAQNPFTNEFLMPKGINRRNSARSSRPCISREDTRCSSLRNRQQENDDKCNAQDTKKRQICFAPYIDIHSVARGMETKSLFKGVLRVDAWNYELATVDLGFSLDDVLIRGVLDRNRAVDGDTVIVRIKDRTNWVVNDILYFAWRKGVLRERLDDNGHPISVPPINAHYIHNLPMNSDGPICHYIRKDFDEVADADTNANANKYTREQLLSIAFKMAKQADLFQLALNEGTKKNIAELSILRDDTSNWKTSSGKGSFCRRTLTELSDDDWGMPDICLQKTAEVVHISRRRASRNAIGILKICDGPNIKNVIFLPTNSRFPWMMIPATEAPIGFLENPQKFAKNIFVASLIGWHSNSRFGIGRLYKCLGLMGDIAAETEGLLLENDLDTREFSPAVLSSLPVTEGNEWQIDEKEFKYRRDFRNHLVFTVETSAVHDGSLTLHLNKTEKCTDNSYTWEVGIHIPDVSNFIQPNTELDNWVSNRVQSIRLIHKTIPMLPKVLTDEICCLKPGNARLAFTVLLKINDSGIVTEKWFGRSIIQVWHKFSADEADKVLQKAEPLISDSIDREKLQEAIKSLLIISERVQQIRTQRLAKCAWEYAPPKLSFKFDDRNSPVELILWKHHQIDSVCEELKILVNTAVAQCISQMFPKTAVLRKRKCPKRRILRDLMEIYGDGTNPRDTITHNALKVLHHPDWLRKVPSAFIHNALSRSVYYCNAVSYAHEFHFEYSVPIYTDFTSPCSRYVDIIVHRQLSAALGYSLAPAFSTEQMQLLLEFCNMKCESASNVESANFEIFFCQLLRCNGSITKKAEVVEMHETNLVVLILDFGWVKPLFYKTFQMMSCSCYCENGHHPKLHIYWPSGQDEKNSSCQQTLTIGSKLDVIFSATSDSIKYTLTAKRPESNTETQVVIE